MKSIAFVFTVLVSIVPFLSCSNDGQGTAPHRLSRIDSDEDRLRDSEDNCPWDYNPEQKDIDGDGWGDPCDNCLYMINELQEDADEDGSGDRCDTEYPGPLSNFPNCKPIFDNQNDEDAKPVNWIFLGYQFQDLSKMRRIISEAVSMDESAYWSLMNVEPFRSHRDEINLWYIDKQGRYQDLTNVIKKAYPAIERDSLLFECPRFDNAHVVIFQDMDDVVAMFMTILNSCRFGDCINTAGSAYIGRGYIWMFSSYPLVPAPYREDAARFYLVHEWGHIFGHLSDHYINDAYGDRISDSPTSPDDECGQWCRGEYRSFDEIENYDCAQFSTKDSCDQVKMQFEPCYWFMKRCINVVEFCSRLERRNICLAMPFCGYIPDDTDMDAWHQSRCIPINSSMKTSDAVKDNRYEFYVNTSYPVINVGLDCDEGTGCYNCGYRDVGRFRADAFTLMREDFLNSYGTYQNKSVEAVIESIGEGEYKSGFWEYHSRYILR